MFLQTSAGGAERVHPLESRTVDREEDVRYLKMTRASRFILRGAGTPETYNRL